MGSLQLGRWTFYIVDDFPRMNVPREEDRKRKTSSDLVSEVTQDYFHLFLLVKSESQTQPRSEERVDEYTRS